MTEKEDRIEKELRWVRPYLYELETRISSVEQLLLNMKVRLDKDMPTNVLNEIVRRLRGIDSEY